jgi:hypothetical protein
LAKSFRAKRNIKINITRFRERESNPSEAIGPVTFKISAILIAMMLPLIVTLFAANVVFRMPDLYSFEFDRSEIAQEVGIDVSAKKMSSTISNFMLHKTDEFSLIAEYKGKDTPILSITDAVRMEKIRGLMDTTFVIWCIITPLSLVLFILTLLFGKKKHLKYACRVSVVIYFVLLLAFAYVAATDGIRHKLTEMFLGADAGAGGLFPQLFTNYFRFEAAAATFVISAIFLGILISICRRFYKETNMFG